VPRLPIAFVLAALFFANAAHADDRFIGRWAVGRDGCGFGGSSVETSPLVVSERSVRWRDTSCSIRKSYLIGDGLYLQAQCSGLDGSRVVPIGLQLKGRGKLAVTWDRAPARELQRCG
jgi:hypothetical protein